MNGSHSSDSASLGIGVRALVLAKGGAFRRLLGSALNELPGVTFLGALSAYDAVIDRVRRNDVDVLFVDPEDIDAATLGKALAEVNHPPSWFALVDTATADVSAGARALLQGASGVIQRRADDDQAALAARLQIGLAPRLAAYQRSQARATPLPRLTEGATGAQAATFVGRVSEPMAGRRELLAIGCSTGGPPAVTALIQALPRTFRLPICIVQHMAAQHMSFFVDGLSRQLARPVKVASDGLRLELDHVYVAAGDAHLLLDRAEGSARGAGLYLRLSKAAHEHNCRPAVDPFFRSVAAVCGAAAIGVVLTGMGSDGALGARALFDVGAPVLVQDANSSVVWGMPGATYQLGGACAVLPLDQLATEILLWTMQTS